MRNQRAGRGSDQQPPAQSLASSPFRPLRRGPTKQIRLAWPLGCVPRSRRAHVVRSCLSSELASTPSTSAPQQPRQQRREESPMMNRSCLPLLLLAALTVSCTRAPYSAPEQNRGPDAPGLKSCGGHTIGPQPTCDSGEYCHYEPGASCGRADAQGACMNTPETSTRRSRLCRSRGIRSPSALPIAAVARSTISISSGQVRS